MNNLFGASFGPGTLIFGNTDFDSSKTSSLSFINENVYDFYGRWVNNFPASTSNPSLTTLGSPFFFNALVYQEGVLADLDATASFFIAGGAGDASNLGVNFPSFIRVTATLTASEASST